MNTTLQPQNITELERRTYADIKRRAKFVSLTMDELCHRAGIAPSTFSRWVNGHNSGYIKTVGKMDEILASLEMQKFRTIDSRIKALGLTLSDACKHIQLPPIDFIRWVKRELTPDYEKIRQLESLLTSLETPKMEQSNESIPAT